MGCILWREAEVQLHLALGLLVALKRGEVDDEVVLDGKDGVGGEVGVVLWEDLGGAWEVAIGGNLWSLCVRTCATFTEVIVSATHHQMDMGRTHGVAVKPAEHHSRRTVCGQRVCGRAQAVEVVLAIGVAAELAAQVVVDLTLWILEVVLAVGRGLPDVDDGVGDALARQRICDPAVGECDEAAGGGAHDDAVAEVAPRSVGAPEGAEDGGRGGYFARL